MKIPASIKKAFRSHGITLNKFGEGETEQFRILVQENPHWHHWDVKIAAKETFNKWGDSTNFLSLVSLEMVGRKKYLIPNLSKELEWCAAVYKLLSESGLINWNSYFYPIQTPFFIE